MKSLQRTDNHHVLAAEGWLELGNYIEANAELENITPALRGHPEVLSLRFQIYSKDEKWDYAAEIALAISEMLPDNPYGPFHLAFSLHELKRTKEAYDVLVAVVGKFPDEHLMSDDKTKTGGPDRDRINVHEPYELESWSKKFGCTHQKLKDTLTKVGPMVKDVERELGS